MIVPSETLSKETTSSHNIFHIANPGYRARFLCFPHPFDFARFLVLTSSLSDSGSPVSHPDHACVCILRYTGYLESQARKIDCPGNPCLFLKGHLQQGQTISVPVEVIVVLIAVKS